MPHSASPYLADGAEWRPDRFYRYDDLTALLETWVAAHPDLATLESIGKTYEGRDIWCVTLTNARTGPHQEKPAYFIDANVHAGEVTGSTVALYTIKWLLDGYGREALATRLLDETTLYVLPRVSADGAERYLTSAESLRSSVRPYPDAEAPEGFHREDMDGDGAILAMRVADPNGPFKASAKDPRVLIPRAPDEVGGTYYWLLPEGRLSDHDPAKDGLVGELKPAVTPYGLDLNRNFPAHWKPDTTNSGGGAYPLSEPETRAVAEFMLNRRNITGSQHYHTFSGVILRPSTVRPDADFHKEDLKRYQALGAIGTEETGYACIAIYDDFLTDKKDPHGGLLLDWAYDHLGLITFSTELWSLGLHIGLKRAEKPLDFYFGKDRTEDDEVAMLNWVDEHLGGFGFTPWRAFEHPQLGPVEIGGWHYKYVIQNAPGPVLEALCERNMRFTLRAAACAPRLVVGETRVERLGEGMWRVEAVIENAGFLPTNVTERAIAQKAAKPDKACLKPGEGVERVAGDAEQVLGFVPGRAGQFAPPPISGGSGRPNRRKVSWVVKGAEGADLTVEARSERGGTARANIRLT
jgi:murein tripeptide amidase MpaA